MTATELTRDDVSIYECDCGRLIRLAYRADDECARCGEPIPSGAVGIVTGDDCEAGRPESPRNRHGTAERWHECGNCGWHNLPIEVTVYPANYDYDVDVAINAGLAELSKAVGGAR